MAFAVHDVTAQSVERARLEPMPQAAAAAATTRTERDLDGPLRIGLLLPMGDPLLARAARAVREGVRSGVRARSERIELVECIYGGEARVEGAYQLCVEQNVAWVIGPLGRNDVAALVAARPRQARPTLLLSPLATIPPAGFVTLAPDLESEAEAIARRVQQDGCRSPLLLEAGGAIAARVAATVNVWWQGSSALPLRSSSVPARRDLQRVVEQWRLQGVDCLIFAGSHQVLSELRPYLRGMAIYVTTATYDAELDRIVDWTGIRIADAPLVIDTRSGEWDAFVPPAGTAPPVMRLHALGVDAARLVLAADGMVLPQSFQGAIGHLDLRDRQYRRTPALGEFRERTLVPLAP